MESGIRNKFRSIESHFAPRSSNICFNNDRDPFSPKYFPKAKIINLGKDYFCGKLEGSTNNVFRIVKIETNGIRITDSSESQKLLDYNVFFNNSRISSSYGVYGKTKIIEKGINEE